MKSYGLLKQNYSTTDQSIFMSNQNKINDIDSSHEADVFNQRFDFNNAPPKHHHGINCNLGEGITCTKLMTHCDSTNSNSPISVTSLDDSIFDHNDQKLGGLNQKPSFYSSHHNFSDEKSSGASSLFSSGM
jgi:hypothetical protein